jgi:hypothetical protein
VKSPRRARQHQELLLICLLLSLFLLTEAASYAQQTTGAPGSPGATTTLDGKCVPSPPPDLGGCHQPQRRRFQDLLARQGSSTGVPSLDAKGVARKTIPHTIPAIMTIDEPFDVGADTRTGVGDNDYQPPFRFTGKLVKLTVNLKPGPTSAEEQKHCDEAVVRAKLAAE